MTGQQTLPCGACGTWECGDCGNRTSSRNRFFPGEHTCPKCNSTNGRMLPTHHQKRRAADHADDVPSLRATMGAPRYPLEEPVSEYPEHDKLKAVQDESDAIGTFLEESGFILAEYRDAEGFAESQLLPVQRSTQQVLADYFKINLNELGREKVKMLDAMREMNRSAAGAGKKERI
ncbi:hypothetical protein [Arthrobacter sp. ES1]|uniref:hypothetical protein n=1 Tax=Arthrobacter sp. ES1 TaxID=1897056 RepID=UPI001CFFE1FF|nr:hypothetical protein [Arthrobacter sp. ES1]MCB5280580.1 hypothetical protein [Arthrobacter sp. ES1]